MNTCPIIHVTKAAPVFQYDATKPIRLGLNTDEAKSAIDEITERINTYDRACKPAVSASTHTNADTGETKIDPYVTKSIANGKMQIVLSSLDKAFHDKYKADLLRYKTSANILTFLGQLFGEQNERQRQANARQQIQNATRRVHDNEPFALFLDRLKSMASTTSKKAEIRDDIVENAFRSNLTPSLNMFLLEHDQLEGTVDTIAQFLDKKQKHNRAASVNAIHLDKMEQMEKMIMNLTQLVQESLIQKPAQSTVDQMEINRIQQHPATKPPTHRTPNFERRRCSKCGMFNHKTSDCSGKCRVICRQCNKQGHLEAVCPSPKNL